jgi:hypothetical protein
MQLAQLANQDHIGDDAEREDDGINGNSDALRSISALVHISPLEMPYLRSGSWAHNGMGGMPRNIRYEINVVIKICNTTGFSNE